MKKSNLVFFIINTLSVALYSPKISAAPSELTIDSITTSNLVIQGNVSGNIGSLTSDTIGVSIYGGSNALLGAGASISIQNATDNQSGLLTATDHAVFSSKLSPIEVTNVVLELTADSPKILLGNYTVYVSNSGCDTNSGLSSQSPFRTIQHAVDVVTTYWMPAAGSSITIQLANGTYSGATLLRGSGSGNFKIVGDPGSPGSVILTNAGTLGIVLFAQDSASWTIDGITLENATYGISCYRGGMVYFKNTVFGSGLQFHLLAKCGGQIRALSNYEISGGGYCHLNASSSAVIDISGWTITLNGTPNFSWQFAQAFNCGVIRVDGCTFSGSATGTRYGVDINGVIYHQGNPLGANFLPGNTAGFTQNGGQYR